MCAVTEAVNTSHISTSSVSKQLQAQVKVSHLIASEEQVVFYMSDGIENCLKLKDFPGLHVKASSFTLVGSIF